MRDDDRIVVNHVRLKSCKEEENMSRRGGHQRMIFHPLNSAATVSCKLYGCMAAMFHLTYHSK